MHRIDKAGHVNNRFSEGNPTLGQRATKVGADWPNAIQEEICTVIEQAGLLLDKNASNQLYLAIVEIVQGAVGDEGEEGSVPTTRQVMTAGLATGGGTLANNLTVTVPAATSAEVAAGIVSNKAITPAALAAAAGSVKSGAARFMLPDGWIIQIGVATALPNSTTIITLPVSFPTTCAFATVEGGSIAADAQDNDPFVSGRGNGSISIYSARDAALSVNWFAIGY